MLLLQDAQPQLVPQHGDSAQLPNQHLHLLKYGGTGEMSGLVTGLIGLGKGLGSDTVPAGPWWDSQRTACPQSCCSSPASWPGPRWNKDPARLLGRSPETQGYSRPRRHTGPRPACSPAGWAELRAALFLSNTHKHFRSTKYYTPLKTVFKEEKKI